MNGLPSKHSRYNDETNVYNPFEYGSIPQNTFNSSWIQLHMPWSKYLSKANVTKDVDSMRVTEFEQPELNEELTTKNSG